jgi:hypothetical protein
MVSSPRSPTRRSTGRSADEAGSAPVTSTLDDMSAPTDPSPTLDVKRRAIGDIVLVAASVLPAIAAFWSDVHNVSDGAFPRTGATMALFAAFLEFRTHEIQMMRSRDAIFALWGSISALTEGLAKVDQLAKYCARELASVIKSAGMEPAIGDPENIKAMVVSERILALKSLPRVPESFYKYSNVVSVVGEVLVVLGTLIWAFGDVAVKHVI